MENESPVLIDKKTINTYKIFSGAFRRSNWNGNQGLITKAIRRRKQRRIWLPHTSRASSLAQN
jgi:hypothetical protein